jgi:RNA polymerase sigma factor (sigma-70 family)
MIVRTQGKDEAIDASPTRIARMLRQVFKNEQKVRAWECMGVSPGRRLVKGEDGKLHWKELPLLVGDSLKKARHARDEHLAELSHVIDYALTTVAYEDVRCESCKLPAAPLDFIRAVPDFEEPAMACQTCLGRGLVRAKRTDPKSKAAFKRVTYFKTALPDVVCCAKIRAGTSDQDAAYRELEARNGNLLVKFGNEKQTSLEEGDAKQGVRQGIIDAAMRFDPTRPEMAQFNTVAYKWCFRNSRARHFAQKRAGVYAPSLDSMGTEDGAGISSFVTSADGALGKLETNPTAHLRNGAIRRGLTCRECGDVSAVDPETWASLGLCEAHVIADAKKKKRKKQTLPPGSDYEPRPRVGACSKELRLDLTAQLKLLPPDERDVVLCYYAEMSDAQTARKLGRTKQQVRALRAEAFESMQAGLTGYVEMLRE